MFWPFKTRTEKALVKQFEMGLRLIQVSLFATLKSRYAETMGSESATFLAAQVVNYLKGEDIALVIDQALDPNKSQIIRIKDQVPQFAVEAMAASRHTREVIVATLRMREIIAFMADGESYFQSNEHQRIYDLLAPYGPEFPEEVNPERYLAMAHRYQEHFGPR
jgi:hypothetical protein